MTAMFPGQIGTARLLVWVLMCAIVLKIFGACLLQWENRCYIDNLSSLNPEMGHPFQSSELFFPREGLNESLMVYLFRVSHWKHDHLSGVEGCFVLMLKSFFKYMQNQFFVCEQGYWTFRHPRFFPWWLMKRYPAPLNRYFICGLIPTVGFNLKKNVKIPFIIPYPSFIYVNIPRFAGFLRKHPNNGRFFFPWMDFFHLAVDFYNCFD